MYVWNLKKWYRWTYLQSRNRDTDTENGHVDIEGGRGDELGWQRWHIHAPPCVKQTSGKLLGSTASSARCSVMTGRAGKGWERGWTGLHCTVKLPPFSANSSGLKAASAQLPVAPFRLDEKQHCIHQLLTMSFLVLRYVLIMLDIHPTLLPSGSKMKKCHFTGSQTKVRTQAVIQ